MPMQELSKVWMDGELVDWSDANVHVLTPTLHYGWGVFEGIRAYETDRGPAIFQHRAHMERLRRSAEALHLEVPYLVDDLMAATRGLIRANEVSSCYIRPLVYLRYGEMGLNPLPGNVAVAIAVWPWGNALGQVARRHGVSAATSSWRRISDTMVPSGVKSCGAYVNSSLAKAEAVKGGYDEALMLNDRGHVAEGPGQNVFIVKDGELLTPPVSDGILRGITRDSIMQWARDLSIPVQETSLLRHDMYTADEAFYTGTAAEVVPITAIDDRKIGSPGPTTRALQDLFEEVVTGKADRYKDLLDYVT